MSSSDIGPLRLTKHSKIDDPISSYDVGKHYVKNCSNPISLMYNTNELVYREENETTGYDISDYHKRVKRGDLLPHTAFYRKWWSGFTSGEFDIVLDSCLHYWREGEWVPKTYWKLTDDIIDDYTPSTDESLIQEAASRIYTKGHDTLTFLVELQKVREMFKSTALKFYRLARDEKFLQKTYLRKKNFKRNIKELANDHLMVRYGWRTLFYDLEDLHKAVTEFDETRKRYSERVGTSYTYTKEQQIAYEATHYSLWYNIFDEVTVSCRGAVTADIRPPKFRFNPILTGWETIPFSFVVDWFLDVGSALGAFSFANLTSASSSSFGYRVELQRTFSTSVKNGNKSGRVASLGASQEGTLNAYWEERKPAGIPSLPQLNVKLDEWKVVDLLALIVQQLK